MIQLELPWVEQRHPSEPLGSGGGWALLRPGSVNLVRSLRVATLENRTDRPHLASASATSRTTRCWPSSSGRGPDPA